MKNFILKLAGGTGNQLFQLAFMNFLQNSYISKVYYDLTNFSNDSYKRKSIIDQLQISIENYDLTKFKDNLFELFEINYPVSFILQHSNLLNKHDHIIVDGYWQDNRLVTDSFISHIKNSILNKFDNNERLLYNYILNSNSVAVHIRRHDYKHHGIVSEYYYIEIINYLLNKYPGLKIYVFSDEPNYSYYFLSKKNIPITIVNHNNDLFDLLLMAACKIHIIANSTFSWWGAKIATSNNVFVPAPLSLIHSESEYLFPESWKIIKNVVDNNIELIDIQNQLKI